jgi:ATP-dependent protease ClpP protease subunit
MEHEVITINGPIGPDGVTAEKFAAMLDDAHHHRVETIEIVVNSDGGSCDDCFKICDAIQSLPVRTIGTILGSLESGKGLSAAGLIWLSCDVRRIAASAYVMVHNPIGGDDESNATAREKSIRHFLSRVQFSTREHTERWFDNETYFSAKDAIVCGLAHEIIPDPRWQCFKAVLSKRNRYWHTSTVNRSVATESRDRKRQPIPLPPIPASLRGKAILSSDCLKHVDATIRAGVQAGPGDVLATMRASNARALLALHGDWKQQITARHQARMTEATP